jgi:RNA polymerase sigma-70 factor (ECF subfamily)
MKNISKLSDEKVVLLVQKKDKELYAEIIRRYEKKLLGYANYLIFDENDAEDVVQNTFIKAYINLNSFKIDNKFSSWIYRITHNEAMNTLNKHKKPMKLDVNIDFDSGVDLEDEVIKKELRQSTQNCLKQMSIIYSEPLSLHFLEEKSYEEISDILRIPIGTVGTRINRAKSIMKKICQR